ncbi:MAG TPA: GNAT family N-acetyltransferase [Chitinophagaceae bacterium]|nr:GNAT family N-acetyltransferase [Chitinophagaceae bacterium]
MVIQHKQQKGSGLFYVQVDGETLAQMTYRQKDADLIIEHTEVDDELRNKNVGYSMVKTAVQYARNNNLKIVPVCPFVKAVFDKKPDYKDVLQEVI